MKYEKGFVFDLMEQGGPNDVREPYFKRFFEVKRIHWRDRWN